MIIATTIGTGPFKPALRCVFNERTIWSIDQEFTSEDNAYAVARVRADIVEEALREAIYNQGFQIVPGT